MVPTFVLVAGMTTGSIATVVARLRIVEMLAVTRTVT
jgi:hypothetical protein